ncbi:hypothetical protein THAOC_11027 [Thalassiosira oceanica]|uniref:Uncharacterized protein n=1 Tax=Thalassiosira oceanica TaxID=159749 RepID=K0TBL2_THAOC|nr:hypothetical protein THAOC_11027 [Thalassiosira oceanica]|eukprot:EJK67872.1 hypothetical protein THAOC_11027 [Thalassiosira oceanica]
MNSSGVEALRLQQRAQKPSLPASSQINAKALRLQQRAQKPSLPASSQINATCNCFEQKSERAFKALESLASAQECSRDCFGPCVGESDGPPRTEDPTPAGGGNTATQGDPRIGYSRPDPGKRSTPQVDLRPH